MESGQSFPGTLRVLAGDLSWFEFVRRQHGTVLQGKIKWDLRVTAGQAGCSLTEPEQEQSRSGGASQGQPS